MSEKETPTQPDPESTPEQDRAIVSGDEAAVADVDSGSGEADAGAADAGAVNPVEADPVEADPGAADAFVADPVAADAGAAEPGAPDPGTEKRSERSVAKRPRGSRWAMPGAVLALLLTAAATTVAAVLWWQYLGDYVALDETDTVLVDDMEGVRADIRRLDDRIAALDEELTESRAGLATRIGRVEGLLDSLPARIAGLERRVNAVQGGSSETRDSFLRVEAEYYLVLANTELELAGRWDNAIAALEIADDKLRELANPALGPVRAAVADELIALNAVESPDIDGIVFTLGRLSERAAELPLRAGGPTRFAPPEAGIDEAEPGLGRLWLGVKNALSNVVTVERREEPVVAVLSAAEQQLVRRQLQLELQLARFAAISDRQGTFQTGLLAARTLLESDFDAASGAVDSAITLLDELAELDVAPPRPDISGSLLRLRALPAEGD